MAEINTELTKKDLWKLFFCSEGFVTGFNYEKQEAPGFVFSMIPVLEKVYSGPEEKKDTYRRHTELSPTGARLSRFVIDLAAAMERRSTNEHDFDPVSIGAIKSALMGSPAGIGDSLCRGTLRPIMAGLVISMVIASNYASVLGPVIFVAVIVIIGQIICYIGIFKGYERGVIFVGAMQNSGMTSKMTRYTGIAAYVVIGGFVNSFVSISIPWSCMADETEMSIQTTLDRMVPGLLSVLCTLLVLQLMKRKEANPILLMLLTMVTGIIDYTCGILASQGIRYNNRLPRTSEMEP